MADEHISETPSGESEEHAFASESMAPGGEQPVPEKPATSADDSPAAAAPETAAVGETPAAPADQTAPVGKSEGEAAPVGEAVAPAEAAPAEAAPAEAAPPATPPPPPEPKGPTVVARYGATGLVGRFRCTLEGCRRGQAVVVKSDRGQEMGEILCGCEATCGGAGEKIVGDVMRIVTHTDEVESRHLHENEERERAFCEQRIAERNLPMKLVEVEHLFGGDRIIFYFTSEQRVDFRVLVRDLAHEFQTRIEMRQVGARDEARLLGDYERCGRPLCCRAWIRELAPVSMRMAKSQRATLDPAKISGHCGRLMCCLRFEHETYRELARNLPRRNTYVSTPDGAGKVVATDVVTQMVGVQLAGGKRINVPVESILERDLDPKAFEESEGRREGGRGEGRQAAPAAATEKVKTEKPPPAAEQAKTDEQPGAAPKGSNGDRDGGERTGRRRGRRGRRRSRRKNRPQGQNGSGGSGPGARPPNASPPQAPEGT